MSKKKKDWKEEKAKLLSMSLEERRRQYHSDHVTLDKILTWRQTSKAEADGNNALMDKVSLYKGDITVLEVDAIVNAANSSLLGGGGVDGCIHKAAGSLLFDECHTLHGCDTGKAKITCGYDLPAKYVIHTVGPVARGTVGQTENTDLAACYKNSLQLAKDNDLHSVAFPCISTGIYGFPNEPAADIALSTVRNWLKDNAQMERVIFCVFLEMDYKIYKEKLAHFFQDNEEETEDSDTDLKEGDSAPPDQLDESEERGESSEGKGIKAEDHPELEKDVRAKKDEGVEEEDSEDAVMDSQLDAVMDSQLDAVMDSQLDAVMDSQLDTVMDSQLEDTDTPEENGSKETATDGETTQPGNEETGSTAAAAAEEEQEEEKMEIGCLQEASVFHDQPADCANREEMKAPNEGSQGSDLSQSDSTQSKDLENNE